MAWRPRVPFLDNETDRFAAQVTAHYKLPNLGNQTRVDKNTIGKRHMFERQTNDGKAILREAMRGVMPGADRSRQARV